MMTMVCSIAVLVLLSMLVVADGRQVISALEDESDMREILDILSKPRKLSRYSGKSELMQLSSFRWQNCGSQSDPTTISSITLSPDPLRLPGNISLGFSGSLTVPLSAPISLDVEVKKKIVFWITVPCIDNVGSCQYSDVCQLLAKFECPAAFKKYGIPCQCPVKDASYSLPATSFYVDDSKLPSFVADGDYHVTARLKQGSREILCLYLELSITKS